jgi:hypothetical protein
MIVGAALVVCGIVWLAQLSAATGYATGVLVPTLLLGIGMGCSILPLNVVILSGVQRQDSGAASGALQTMQQVGGSLGLAILVTVFGTASRDAATHPLAGVTAQTQAHAILAHGIAGAFSVAALFAACALVVVLAAIRTRPTNGSVAGAADRSNDEIAGDDGVGAVHMDLAS